MDGAAQGLKPGQRLAYRGHATFDGDDLAFTLKSVPLVIAATGDNRIDAIPNDDIPLGRYELPRRSDEAHVYRLQHPLAQSLLTVAQRTPLEPCRLHLDYDAYGSNVSVLKTLRGSAGVAAVQLVRVESLGAAEEFLIAASITADQLLDADVTEKLLSLPGRAEALPRVNPPPQQQPAPPSEFEQQQEPPLDFGAAHVALPAALQQD